MVETYHERTIIALLATDPEGNEAEAVPPQKRREILHRCGGWCRVDMRYCGWCGGVLHRKDGTLI